MEKKKNAEAEEAKRVRALNVAKLKQNKFVRENDENWKSDVSAACSKSGFPPFATNMAKEKIETMDMDNMPTV
jgi:hypothetical protein